MNWAWRGVRRRGWRAVFAVLLLGTALAANTVVFSAADAFLFRAVPYHEPDRLAVIERTDRGTSDYIWPQALAAWRDHTDIFTGVEGHDRGPSAYVTQGGITETVRAALVTPGLFELLGALPRWGRPLVRSDAVEGAPPVAIIGEALARRLFGHAEGVIGLTFSTGSETLTIVGVMPASFRFPSATEEIWRPLNLDNWPSNRGLRNVARLAAGQTMEDAIRAVQLRTDSVAEVVDGPAGNDRMRLRSLAEARRNTAATTVFALLLGAAACLLMIACANVASLETAAAVQRVRAYAIQAALGATRASLVRVSLLEGVILLGAGALVAGAFAAWGGAVLERQLTVAMRDALTNPLDLDSRSIGFMLVLGTVTWLLTSLPAVWQVTRISVADGLRDDSRVMPVTLAASRSRQVLMTAQIALTVLLLVGALLYVESFVAHVGVDKGFDAARIATIQVVPAPDAGRRGAELESAVLERLRALPGIRSVSRTGSLPPSTQSGIGARLTVDERDPTDEMLMIHFASVDPEYFSTMGIAIVEGAKLDANTPPEAVVIDERFARAHWPASSPVGSRFTMGNAGVSGIREFRVFGVSRELRTDRQMNERDQQVFVAYIRIAPTYNPLTFVARLNDDATLGTLGPIVRSVAERSVVRIDTIEGRYARLHADTRLAAAVTAGFGLVAIIVATGGVYAVMAFLVSGRRREIGIRLALGAGPANVQKLVFASSLRFVVIGVGFGLTAAAIASRWIAAQLFGVTPIDPATYFGVTVLVVFTAVAATWWPARRASRIDPAITLRTE